MRHAFGTHRALAALAGLLAALAIGATTGLAAVGLSRPADQALGTRSHAAKVPLIVYSAQGYDMNEVHAFQKATGIPTELVCDSTGPLLARIAAQRNNPQWGLLWVDGNQPFAALDRQGLMLRGFEPAVRWTSTALKLIPNDKSFIPTGITIAATLIYNSKRIKTPPTDFRQLLLPQYKGLLGMNNPSISGPTYPYVSGLMAYMGGIKQGEEYLLRLKANGLHIFPTNGNTLHALQIGQIAMATIQSSAIIGAVEQTPGWKISFFKGVTLLPSNIGIDPKAPPAEVAEAKRFASYVLSHAGQQQMLTGDPHGDSNFWPLIQGESPRPGMPALSSVPYQATNPYLWGPRESSINSWFTAHIVQ